MNGSTRKCKWCGLEFINPHKRVLYCEVHRSGMNRHITDKDSARKILTDERAENERRYEEHQKREEEKRNYQKWQTRFINENGTPEEIRVLKHQRERLEADIRAARQHIEELNTRHKFYSGEIEALWKQIYIEHKEEKP